MRGIQVRPELTEEWKHRDVGEQKEYAILAAEICKATFGVTPVEYKKLKGVQRENLRDHMTDLELIFTMLGEASTTEITREHALVLIARKADSPCQGLYDMLVKKQV